MSFLLMQGNYAVEWPAGKGWGGGAGAKDRRGSFTSEIEQQEHEEPPLMTQCGFHPDEQQRKLRVLGQGLALVQELAIIIWD